MPDLPIIIALLFALPSILALLAAIGALKKKRVLGAVMAFLVAALFLSLSALFGTIGISIQGYRALIREELAAVVRIEPTERQKFTARFTFPDHTVQEFSLAGDQLYVDAHILKWKPLANLFGLHTSYELDRVAGRYASIRDELHGIRTVYALSKNKPVDLFHLRRRFAALSPLLDAEYGSATFVESDKAAEFNIMVSATGLLIRETGKAAGPQDAPLGSRRVDKDREGIQAAPDPI